MYKLYWQLMNYNESYRLRSITVCSIQNAFLIARGDETPLKYYMCYTDYSTQREAQWIEEGWWELTYSEPVISCKTISSQQIEKGVREDV